MDILGVKSRYRLSINSKMNSTEIQKIIDIAFEAGKAIMDIYEDEQQFKVVDYKSDDSPLTLADRKSHEIIVRRLQALYPEIPVLSEEGKNIAYEKRKDWKLFWLVDPLDGTKEFIKRNGEFTVNIALIRDRFPVNGVIYAPALDKIYYNENEEGAFCLENGINRKLEPSGSKKKGLIAVRSRSHASPEEDDIFKKNNVTDYISVGSSLKFCMVAEGKAGLYYRHGPTMEWDTAAGQAIVESAGYEMKNMKTGERFRYNKESLLNPGFIVS